MSEVTKNDLKSIAITSAIAAAGTALATSIVEIVLTRYWLKEEEGGSTSTEPTFVVVPVVDRPVPQDLPVAGFGSLARRLRGKRIGPLSHKGRRRAMSLAMRGATNGLGLSPRDQLVAEVRSHPRCYSNLFSYCFDDDKRYEPQCRQFDHWHQLYDVDKSAWDEEVNRIPFCDYDKRDMALGVAVGCAIGIAVWSALSLHSAFDRR